MSRRSGPLHAFLAAYLISGFGTAMSAVAIPWLVLVSTGSPAATGVVAFAQMAPYVIMLAAGGPLVDRLGLRRAFLIGNSVAAAAMTAIMVLNAAGLLRLGVLAAVVAVAGTARGAADAATTPMLPPLAQRAGQQYERAVGLYSGANRTALLAGMPLAGVLIAITGAAGVVLIDGATFAAGALIVAAAMPRSALAMQRPEAPGPPQPGPVPAAGQPAPPARSAGRQPGALRRYAASLAEGLLFLRADRLLLGLIALTSVTNLLDEALSSVLLPVWAHDRVHHAIALGLAGGTLGLGMLLGVLAGAWLGARLPRRLTFGAGYLISAGPPFLVLACSTSLVVVLPVWLVCGVAGGVLNPILGAVQFERVPARLQARVLGVSKASAWLGVPFGALLGGFLTGAAGLTAALAACGAVMLAVTLAPLVLPAYRGLQRPPDPVRPEPAPG